MLELARHVSRNADASNGIYTLYAQTRDPTDEIVSIVTIGEKYNSTAQLHNRFVYRAL